MVTPSWVRNRKYKIYPSPTGSGRRTVVHFSPGPARRKTTVTIPATARNVTQYLREYYRASGSRPVRRSPVRSFLLNVNRRYGHRISPSPSAAARARKNVVFPFKLNKNVQKHLYQNSTNNGRTGHQLTSLNTTTTNLRTKYNIRLGPKVVRRGMAKLGSGTQGVVYLACTTRACTDKLVIKVSPTDTTRQKQPSDVEFTIQKAVFKVVPTHVAVPYKLIRAVDFAPASKSAAVPGMDYHHQIIMFSEYCPGGDFDTWLNKVRTRLTDQAMAGLIHQIIAALKKIHTRHPQFRHNDLHLKNVLVDDRSKHPRMVISDFGLARLTAKGSNPIVNSAEFNSYGITSSTDVRYDAHLFLNALRVHLHRGGFGHLHETIAFLDRVVPPGYRGQTDKYIHESRLRGKVFPGLPHFADILVDPFMTNVNRVYKSPGRNISSPTVRNLINVLPYNTGYVRRPSPRAPTSNRHPSPRTPTSNRHPSPRTPTSNRRVAAAPSGRNAAEIARNALANLPGVSVTTTAAARPSAAEFLRMSPRTRAAHMTGARGARNASRTVMVRNVTRGHGANRERLTARRVPAGTVARLPLGTGSRVTTTAGLYPEPSRRRTPSPAVAPSVRRSPVVRARVNAGTLLNLFSKAHNARVTTKKNLKTELTRRGYAPASARREVAAWLPGWEASRRNLAEATRLAKLGVNLNYRGYPANVAAVAKRHANLSLAKSPGGRVRSGKALLLGKKREALVNMARRHGLNHAGKTKQQLVNALFG